MKNVFTLLGLILLVQFVNGQIITLTPGQPAPEFALMNVDNKQVGFRDFPDAKGFIVVFTCNTCPVSQAYEQRIKELDQTFAKQGYPVIAINPNDPAIVEGDSFEKMQARAKQKQYSFPYLYDPGQKITDTYGARNTPHVFLVSRNKKEYLIEYAGAIDNDSKNSNPERTRYLEKAIYDLQQGRKPVISSTKAIGCSVKRKQQA
jgi:peroxiredoxin